MPLRYSSPLQRSVDFIQRDYYAYSEGQMDRFFWNKLADRSTFDDWYWGDREVRNNFAKEPAYEQQRENYQKLQQARALYSSDNREAALGLMHQIITKNPEQTRYSNELHTLTK